VGITPERDDFRRIKSDQIKAGRLGRYSVATYAPANDDEQIPVLGPQAPGEEITLSLLATAAPLGYALGHPPGHVPAQASAPASIIILLFLSVSPLADPLAEATP
jgi:hypothetical protein